MVNSSVVLPRYFSQRVIVFAWCDYYAQCGMEFPPLKHVSKSTGIAMSRVSEYRAEWIKHNNFQIGKTTIANQ